MKKLDFIIHPSAPGAVAILITLLALSGLLLTELQLNNAPEVYLPYSEPAVKFERKLRKIFPSDKVLVAVFRGDNLYSDDFLRRFNDAVHEIQNHPNVERVLGITSVDHIASSDDNGFVVETLIEPGNVEYATGEQRKYRAITDRFAPGSLVARDGNAIAMVVRTQHIDDSKQSLTLDNFLRTTILKYQLDSNLSGIAGEIALDAAQLQSFIHNMTMFVPITTILGLLLIWWMFKRIFAVVVAGLVIGLTSNASMGLVVLFQQPYTLIDSMIPSLITALTVALLVHFYNALAHASRRGWHGEQRVRHALQEIRRPAWYTTLTTIVGLASLGVSPITPIKTFGFASAGGMLLLYVVVIYILPPIFIRWDNDIWPNQHASANGIARILRYLSDIGIRRAGWVVALATIGIGVGAGQIWKVTAETDIYRFFSDSHPINQSTHEVENNLSGVTSVEVVFEGKDRDILKNPQILLQIKKIQNWLDALPEVDRTISAADILEEMNWAFHNERPEYRTLPKSKNLLAQYLFIYDGRDLYDLIDRDFKNTRITMNLNIHSAGEIQAVMQQIRKKLEASDLNGLMWHIAGLGRLYSDQAELLIKSQVKSLWVVLTLIFIIMAIQWRSTLASLLCMIPNISPILVIFILMGIFGIWLDMATAMIASVAVGIAVDDTIHIYHGYRKRRDTGSSHVWALARTYRQTGRAVLVTTFILFAQFSILTMSDFVPVREFGLLTALGVLAAFFFDLLLLPALIVLSVKFNKQPGATHLA